MAGTRVDGTVASKAARMVVVLVCHWAAKMVASKGERTAAVWALSSVVCWAGRWAVTTAVSTAVSTADMRVDAWVAARAAAMAAPKADDSVDFFHSDSG